MAKRQRDPGKEQFWRELVTRWQASGRSARAFCAPRGITEASLYAGRRELQRRASPGTAKSAFVPVTVVPATRVEVRCPSGHVVTLPNADLETLRQLFAALTPEAPC